MLLHAQRTSIISICISSLRSMIPALKRVTEALGAPIIGYLKDYVHENALLSAGGLIVLEIGSNMFLKYRALQAPVEAFTHGVVPDINTTTLIPRLAELEALSHLIRIEAPNSNKYVIVVGEHGTGKTTLMQQVLNSKNVKSPINATDLQNVYSKRGCVYISIPVSRSAINVNEDGDLLGDVFGIENQTGGLITRSVYRLASHISKTSGDNRHISLEGVLKILQTAAMTYFSRTGKIPVLVIDNINILATEAPDYLRILQNQAKEWADKAILTVVFVASDGAAPPQMRSNSSYSRAMKYNLGGIPDSDAVRYLEVQGFQQDLAQKVVQRLTGGKLTLLKTVSSKFNRTYEEIQSILFDKVREDVDALLSVAEAPAGAVVTAILESSTKTISIDRFEELIRETTESAHTRSAKMTLSCSQVITVMNDTVSFQNPVTLEYAVQHRSRFVHQKRLIV